MEESEDELEIKIGVSEDLIFIDFSKPTVRVGMDRDTARQIGFSLLNCAELIKNKGTTH